VHQADEAALFGRLDELMEMAKSSLEIKRKVIQRHMDAGLFPYTKRYLGTLRNHFSTIGVNGINEMIRNFSVGREDISSEWGHHFASRFLDHIRTRMTEFQEQTGHMYNLEATPAEGTTYRFAKEDRKRYPGIMQAGSPEAPYYTNSSQLPVGFTDDPFEALERQEELQQKYTGGTVLHLYMSERLSSTEACKTLVRRALGRFRIPYITVTPTFSICPSHGYIAGEHKYCPRCDQDILAHSQTVCETDSAFSKQAKGSARQHSTEGGVAQISEQHRQPCEVWTRVMGYHRPVSEYNPGKQSEHAERIHFLEKKTGLSDG
jgi:ribonucleoside-triphosphate reductase